MADTKKIYIKRRMVVVQDEDKTIFLSKDQINAMRMLQEGQYDGQYSARIYPYNRFKLQNDKSIVVSAMAENDDTTIHLSNKIIKRIYQFRDNNRPKLLWEREMRRY